ncbi:LysR family transcriptional regulator [Enterobacteriaceae bacterium H11S18]|uniref:LysR family transcriptional regulator n=1 Tax=Dryocola clanedunensis TaxID=2925396 RepID=UPI0022F023D3|nr:LysR family transcriptional regulator [Dryocola clanedunensis]MCT4711104.1 LysR family transcriptional regulator [Dryocola clanedunensis]
MNNYNLSTLKIVNGIIEHKTAQKAASVLGMSNSSISYALKKLRHETGKQLFTRSKHGLVPDKNALELQKIYKEIQALSGNRREFIITTYPPVELLIGLHMQTLSHEDLLLQFQEIPGSAEQRLKNLRHRSVDIDIGSQLPMDNSIIRYPYLVSDMRVMVSKNHSTIQDTFTSRHWYENQHVIWLRDDDEISTLLEEMEKERTIFENRKVACESTSLPAMIYLCAYSDNIMLLPEVFVPSFEKIFPVKSFKMPWDINLKFEFYIHYHREINKDPNTEFLIRLFDGLV